MSYNTVINKWTVNMQKGAMDLNALWWSNNDTIAQGQINLSKADNSLNMQGTGVVWDGYQKISATGLSGREHNGSSLLTAGSTYTYNYNPTQGVDLESWIAAGTLTLGIRATSVNGSDGIKAVNSGWDLYVPPNPVAANDTGSGTEAGGTNNGTPGNDSANQDRFVGFTGTPTTPAGGSTQTDYILGYTLHDGQGGTGSGTVNLRIQATTASGNSITIDQIGNDYS